MQPTSYEEIFKPRGKEVRVNLLSSECSACGARFTSGSQHDENLKRLDLRRTEYGDVLLGEDIVAFRMRYGITQTAAAKIFGKSKIAFSRYENEAFYPDASTTKLLRLAMELPQVLKKLADAAGVPIPLWEARCADERKTKVVELIARSAKPQAPSFWTRAPKHDLSSAELDWAEGGRSSVEITPAVNDEAYGVEAQAS
ncbi:MAG: type II toxin-antitoxin system MqsA family antitoxin [Xanthomonadales bacterium]|nr:type II toxin-antitoxin system MqsA family antitoxin [Xanthomonadales bacterium]